MKYIILGCFTTIGLASLLVVIYPAKEPSYGNLSGWEWLDVVYLLGHLKLLISLFKYCPQAYLNYVNKSTRGYSIYISVMDFSGSILSLVQLSIDALLTPGGFRSVIGNPLKFWLGWISIVFDIIFALQHWVFYPAKKSSTYLDVYENEQRITGRLQVEGEGTGFSVHCGESSGQREYGTIITTPLERSEK